MKASAILSRAYDLLNDPNETLWDDARLLRYATDAERFILQRHQYAAITGSTVSTLTASELTELTDENDDLEVADQWGPAVVEYVVGMALMEDGDDDANKALGAAHLSAFWRTI